MVKYRAEEMTMEHMQRWREDPTAVQCAINPKQSREALPDTPEGNKAWHIIYQMPMVLSNRSVITAYYETEEADGTQVVFHSSKGNDEIAASIAEQVGSNVIAENRVTMLKYKPFDGGVEIHMMACFDPAGLIPGFVKNRIASYMGNMGLMLVDYLMDGTVPEPIF